MALGDGLKLYNAAGTYTAQLKVNASTGKLELLSAAGSVLIIFETHASRHSYGGADPLPAASVKGTQIKFYHTTGIGLLPIETVIAIPTGFDPKPTVVWATRKEAGTIDLYVGAVGYTNVTVGATAGKTFDVWMIK